MSLGNRHSRPSLALLRDYSNSFDLYNVAKLTRNGTGGNDDQVKTENEKITVRFSINP